MPDDRTFTDGVMTLREIVPADTQLLYDWRNDAATRVMFRDDQPLNFDSHSRFVDKYLAGPSPDYWWIAEVAGMPVGTISLYHFSLDRKTCEFGRFIIGREQRGLGYGRRALALAMNAASSLGVERLLCEVLSSNACALRLYDSLGFTAKGIDQAGPRPLVLMEAELNPK